MSYLSTERPLPNITDTGPRYDRTGEANKESATVALHRVLSDDLANDTTNINIVGDEAHHAIRVKRLQAGDRLEVLNGRGLRAIGVITSVHKLPRTGDWAMDLQIEACHTLPRTSPRVEVWTSTPKGARLDEMVEGLSEAGAASWHPLQTERTVVDPREHKLQRLERLLIESAKQSGRAWPLEIHPGGLIEAALRFDGMLIVCDGSGTPWSGSEAAKNLRILVGPEGGWTDAELNIMKTAGARVHRFGPHVMRIETAAVVACGVVLSAAAHT